MADHGIARLSLEDVANGPPVAPQTVYRYFPSKGVLLEATVCERSRSSSPT